MINAKEAGRLPGTHHHLLAAERGDGMRLLVEDHGPLMTTSSASRASEPFHTTRSGPPGIGLPVAARLAEKNGGRLALEARAAGGTRAILRLPCWKRP
ncbi:MAG: sensor histidine kinase [Gemmatimonadetes bacterium]|nr:sensor histidine kinase [Gemmatimonadota bacterium]